MVSFLAVPVPDEYQAPAVLFVAGLAFLVHGAWCRYMGETNEYYPTDSRVLPDIGRGQFGEPEDIGFDTKFLICMIVGGGLVLCAALLLPLSRYARSRRKIEPSPIETTLTIPIAWTNQSLNT